MQRTESSRNRDWNFPFKLPMNNDSGSLCAIMSIFCTQHFGENCPTTIECGLVERFPNRTILIRLSPKNSRFVFFFCIFLVTSRMFALSRPKRLLRLSVSPIWWTENFANDLVTVCDEFFFVFSTHCIVAFSRDRKIDILGLQQNVQCCRASLNVASTNKKKHQKT